MKDKLRDFFDPNRSLPLFILGTAALTLVLSAMYDFANKPGQWQGGYGLAIGAAIIALVVLVVSSQRTAVSGRVNLREEQKPTRRKGLILLASPQTSSAPAAIEYHLPTLQHCWVLASSASRATALALEQSYETGQLRVHQGSAFTVDEDQIQSTYDKVIQIIDEAGRYGLTLNDLIADITGGVKPMTAGMTLACLARRCDIQYMKTLRNDVGEILPEAQTEPIQIDIAFIPETVFREVKR